MTTQGVPIAKLVRTTHTHTHTVDRAGRTLSSNETIAGVRELERQGQKNTVRSNKAVLLVPGNEKDKVRKT